MSRLWIPSILLLLNSWAFPISTNGKLHPSIGWVYILGNILKSSFMDNLAWYLLTLSLSNTHLASTLASNHCISPGSTHGLTWEVQDFPTIDIPNRGWSHTSETEVTPPIPFQTIHQLGTKHCIMSLGDHFHSNHHRQPCSMQGLWDVWMCFLGTATWQRLLNHVSFLCCNWYV